MHGVLTTLSTTHGCCWNLDTYNCWEEVRKWSSFLGYDSEKKLTQTLDVMSDRKIHISWILVEMPLDNEFLVILFSQSGVMISGTGDTLWNFSFTCQVLNFISFLVIIQNKGLYCDIFIHASQTVFWYSHHFFLVSFLPSNLLLYVIYMLCSAVGSCCPFVSWQWLVCLRIPKGSFIIPNFSEYMHMNFITS